MKKKKLVPIVLFMFLYLLTTANLFAQDSTKKTVICFVPQYFLIHGVRVDVERNLNFSKHWLVLSPQVYSGSLFLNNTHNYSQYPYDEYKDKVLGFGMALSHKFFLQDYNKGFYIKSGIAYQYFELSRKEYDWVPYTENGLEYYDYLLTDGKDIISKYAVNAQAGIRALGGNVFVFDVYGGFGFSYSEKKSDNPELRNYERFPWDYNYNGIYPTMGIKFGAYF
jgi:hypothetical protein